MLNQPAIRQERLEVVVGGRRQSGLNILQVREAVVRVLRVADADPQVTRERPAFAREFLDVGLIDVRDGRLPSAILHEIGESRDALADSVHPAPLRAAIDPITVSARDVFQTKIGEMVGEATTVGTDDLEFRTGGTAAEHSQRQEQRIRRRSRRRTLARRRRRVLRLHDRSEALPPLIKRRIRHPPSRPQNRHTDNPLPACRASKSRQNRSRSPFVIGRPR